MEAVKLANPPIIEMIVDIGCSMPPGHDITMMQTKFSDAYREKYPKSRTIFAHQHQIASGIEAPSVVKNQTLTQGYQFLQIDEKQVVQAKVDGFSFNRLAPYSSLDEYLSEIERTWEIFVGIASPVVTSVIQLRFINRIKLPGESARLKLDEYFKVSPHLPDEINLTFNGFLNQHLAVDNRTGNNVSIVLASQTMEASCLPVILDITAFKQAQIEPKNWEAIKNVILSLRDLKNSVFFNTLTPSCIKLFQQQLA